MALYAVGDLQGCLTSLKQLLNTIEFDPTHDELWLTGDLVSRGPESLETLRFVKNLGACARCVLGNHDLHLLRTDAGVKPAPADGTLDDVLTSPDREELITWLRQQPLFITDPRRRLSMVHAGLIPEWTMEAATVLAGEAERQLRGNDWHGFLERIRGALPEQWREDLDVDVRMHATIATMTHLRFCDAAGRMALDYKREPGTQPDGFRPWFELPHRRDPEYTVIFGHWSALGFVRHEGVLGLDTGCVWEGELTAVRLDGEGASWGERFSVAC